MTTTAILKLQPAPEPLAVKFFDAGGTVFHRHTCSNGPHAWDCSSPYCTSLQADCPDHGGDEPVKIGREPWKR